MNRPTTTDNDDHERPLCLMDITAVATRLGVSVRHVRRLVHERRIPYIKWGHLIRFDPTDIEPWIDNARRSGFGALKDGTQDTTRASGTDRPARRS